MSALKRAAVIGWPVRQSLSPRLHSFWLKTYGIAGEYTALAVEPQDFARVVAGLPEKGFVGANVTVPHKEAAFALTNLKSDDARITGAVNMLVFEEGRVQGFNTDIGGFAAHLQHTLGGDWMTGKIAVVLGAGGAARGVALALARLGASEIRVLNRTRSRADALKDALGRFAPLTVLEWGAMDEGFAGASLLVNTTSLGMTGKEPLQLSLGALPKDAAVADIVYNPLETELLRTARREGRPTVDGLGMLMHQAVPAFARWFGVTPEVTLELRAELEQVLKNG